MTRWVRGMAVLAAAVGLALSVTGPAAARPAPAAGTAPSVLIGAKSAFPPVTHDVFVEYHGGADARATVFGYAENAKKGEVLRLLARPFPFHAAPVREQALTLTGGGSQPYSFTVSPSIATHYTVGLYRHATDTKPIVFSNVQPVYLTEGGTSSRPNVCQHPVCHQKISLQLIVPASTLTGEAAKHWHVYVGVRTGPAGHTPPAPAWLNLDPKATASKARKLSATTFTTTLRFSFRIGTKGFRWLWTACLRDTEASDGLGLPGSHGCGDKRVKNGTPYLG
jgi:hypothetical protein